jgi:GTPase-associated protein 1, N-terminal domain type 2
MPQQLIYTSAPRGVVAGRSGHCTVARSAAMREALMLQLEKLSYYQHLSLSGGRERPIHCCRLLDIRGSRYHVLTRIQDAGLDFTGRTNFVAHHLVFAPEEVRQFASPPVILGAWSGWVNSWNKEPELFNNEDWSSLAALSGGVRVPAVLWQQVTGDAANGYGLLEARVGSAFRVDGMTDEQVLGLFTESLELLDLRDQRRDFRASAWQYTFTTSMQEQDNPADFRWRCLHSDNPAGNRFAGADCRALSEVRASRVSNEEAIFARSGRQPPRFVLPPENLSSVAGETARLRARAEGVPTPAYQWFTVDRSGKSQAIAEATGEELAVQNPPLGVTRYAVRASNSLGEVMSEVVMLSVEQKGSAAVRPPVGTPNPVRPATGPHIKSEEDIERQRRQLEAEQQKKPVRKWPFIILGIALLVGIAGAIALQGRGRKKSQDTASGERHETNAELSNVQPMPSSPIKEMTKATLPVERAKTNSAVVELAGKTPGPVIAANQPLFDGIAKLPAPWAARRIGSGTGTAGAGVEKSDIVVFGAGKNIDGQADNFFFVQQPVSGPVEFASRIKSAGHENASRQGIMIRESTKADASFAFIGLSQTSVLWVHRDSASSTCQFTNVPIVPLPVYLRLTKRTNGVCGAYSANGTRWTWLGTNQITFAEQNYLIGLAVASGNAAGPVKAVFDEAMVNNL